MWRQVFAAAADRPDTWCKGCGYYPSARRARSTHSPAGRSGCAPLVDNGDARCRDQDPELWFPLTPADERNKDIDKRTVAAKTMTAIALCNTCPIRAACLQWAIDTDTRYGIYGGLTEDQRAQLTGRRP